MAAIFRAELTDAGLEMSLSDEAEVDVTGAVVPFEVVKVDVVRFMPGPSYEGKRLRLDWITLTEPLEPQLRRLRRRRWLGDEVAGLWRMLRR